MASSSLRQNKLLKANELLTFDVGINIYKYYLRKVILLFRLFKKGSQFISFSTFLTIWSMHCTYSYVLTSATRLYVNDVKGIPLRIEYIPCSLCTDILSCYDNGTFSVMLVLGIILFFTFIMSFNDKIVMYQDGSVITVNTWFQEYSDIITVNPLV